MFMDTYMLRHQSILKLFTNKVPSFFFNFNLNVKERTKLDIYKRQKLILTNEKNDKFHIIISEIIKDFLPKSMIENYWKIIDEIVNDKYYQKIKIIFTTNTFGKAINITYGCRKSKSRIEIYCWTTWIWIFRKL